MGRRVSGALAVASPLPHDERDRRFLRGEHRGGRWRPRARRRRPAVAAGLSARQPARSPSRSPALAARHFASMSWPLSTEHPGLLVAAALLLVLAQALKAFGWDGCSHCWSGRRRWRSRPATAAPRSSGFPSRRFDDAMRIAVVRRYPGCPAGVRVLCLSLVMLGLIDRVALAPLALAGAALPISASASGQGSRSSPPAVSRPPWSSRSSPASPRAAGCCASGRALGQSAHDVASSRSRGLGARLRLLDRARRRLFLFLRHSASAGRCRSRCSCSARARQLPRSRSVSPALPRRPARAGPRSSRPASTPLASPRRRLDRRPRSLLRDGRLRRRDPLAQRGVAYAPRMYFTAGRSSGWSPARHGLRSASNARFTLFRPCMRSKTPSPVACRPPPPAIDPYRAGRPSPDPVRRLCCYLGGAHERVPGCAFPRFLCPFWIWQRRCYRKWQPEPSSGSTMRRGMASSPLTQAVRTCSSTTARSPATATSRSPEGAKVEFEGAEGAKGPEAKNVTLI